MNPALASLLACPSCRGAWSPVAGPRAGLEALSCPRCGVRVPVVEGFPLFPERAPDDGSPVAEWLAAAAGDDADYAAFVEQKRRRGVLDTYAAWAPFNESGRTILAFVPMLREFLRDGDAILDLSDRTGWSGELLAGLFPRQRVVSAWEGNNDCLGYRGYREWLGADGRAANHDAVFFDPKAPLPLATGAFRFVHGYDVLHDLRLEEALPELRRVTTPDAAMIFPHVHLRSAEFEPEFDRHGNLRPPEEYRRVLGREVEGSGRSVCVLGEATEFARQKAGHESPLADQPGSPDYNGVVAIVPTSWVGRPLAVPALPEPLDRAAVFANPLFDVDPASGAVSVSGRLSEMPDRHPVYAKLLPAATAAPLDARERLVHFWAKRSATAGEIAARIGETVPALRPVLAALERREIVRAAPVGRGAVLLQRFHADLEDAPLTAEDDLPAVWRGAVKRWPGRVYIVDDGDGGQLTFAEADRIIAAMTRRLRADGVVAGDRVAVCAPMHFEEALLLWASAFAGAAFAIVDHTLPPSTIAARIRRLKPRLLFTSAAIRAELKEALPCPVVLLDPSAGEPLPPPGTSVSEWLREEDYEGSAPGTPPGCAELPAAIIFTSGTTGDARGAVITQHGLANSGRMIARHCGWRREDVLMCPAELQAMMSLRTCVTCAHVGSSMVVAPFEVRTKPALLAECIARRRVTALATSPPMFRQLSLWSARMPPGVLGSLRRVVSAGSVLTAGIRAEFERNYGLAIMDLYGLTETTGLCVGEPAEPGGPSNGSIGRAVDALLRVVGPDGSDVPPGAEGELCVHSANLFAGYFDDPDASRASFSGPWFRTKDRARIAADGSCFLAGRLQDAIKNLFSEWVSVREVQEALDALPDIADAAVGAYMDQAGQEHLGAVIVPRDAAAARDRDAWLAGVRARLLEKLGERRMPTRLVARDRVKRSANGKFVAGAEKEWLVSHE